MGRGWVKGGSGVGENGVMLKSARILPVNEHPILPEEKGGKYPLFFYLRRPFAVLPVDRPVEHRLTVVDKPSFPQTGPHATHL